MKNGVILTYSLALALLGCGGGDRDPEVQDPAETKAPSLAMRDDLRSERPLRFGATKSAVGNQALRPDPDVESEYHAESEIPGLRLLSIVEDPHGFRLRAIDTRTGRIMNLSEGDEYIGYSVKKIDPVGNVIEIFDEDRAVTLVVEAENYRQTGFEDLMPLQNAPAAEHSDPFRFEATEAEFEHGVDPNDSTTWPAAYRGPAIERELGLLGQQEGPDANRWHTGSVYEQTPSERARGIDPNAPATWPEDYRGPEIERSIGFEYDRDGIGSLDLPIIYAPTPSEISLGIDPNDPATWPEDYRGPAIERAMSK